jgi:hypothetical protein
MEETDLTESYLEVATVYDQDRNFFVGAVEALTLIERAPAHAQLEALAGPNEYFQILADSATWAKIVVALSGGVGALYLTPFLKKLAELHATRFDEWTRAKPKDNQGLEKLTATINEARSLGRTTGLGWKDGNPRNVSLNFPGFEVPDHEDNKPLRLDQVAAYIGTVAIISPLIEGLIAKGAGVDIGLSPGFKTVRVIYYDGEARRLEFPLPSNDD